MAEIKIEQKKQIWPWLLAGLVVAALLVYFLVFHNTDKNTEAVAESEYMTNTERDRSRVKESNGAVAAYITFVENKKESMGLDHDYTNEALIKLIEATKAKANEVEYEVRADLGKAREYAKMITNDPHATTHANSIRKAFDVISNVLQNIQKAEYPGLANEVNELKSASESIKPEVLTLDQQDAVKNFFAKAADLLQKMN